MGRGMVQRESQRDAKPRFYRIRASQRQ